jgi:tryptophan synthase alpha chain
MSRITSAFSNGKAFIAFLTAGDPSAEKSLEFIQAMIQGGADLVEIGIPFSDPIAEGPVIQTANLRALNAGATIDTAFEIVSKTRRQSNIPLVFLTYLNPVHHYGYEAFFARCANVGLDGIIIPDLPLEERAEVKIVSDQYGVDLIALVAPTSQTRIRAIAADAKGFVYLVSSMGVTGVRSTIETDVTAISAAIREATDIPVAVGFGIHSPEQAAAIAGACDGVIVGSAIVKIIAEYGDAAAPYIQDYVAQMKQAVTAR